MRSKAEIYSDLSKVERHTPTYNILIKELYDLLSYEADAEYALLKAAGYSDDEIYGGADEQVKEFLKR